MSVSTTLKTNTPKNTFGIFEDAQDRNYTFEEKQYIIGNVMFRRAAMMRTAHMDEEDVRQDLSLRLLELLDTYNPERCRNLDAYLTLMLGFHLVGLRRGSMLTGMPGAPRYGFFMVSLDQENSFGNRLEIPVEDTHSSVVWVENAIDALPARQRNVITRLLSGARVSARNKNLRAARVRLRNSLEEWRPQHA